jgi:PAS domain S-box-containing protein
MLVLIGHVKDFSLMKRFGKLDQIYLTLSGVIYKESMPHLLLNLDILSREKSFSEDDKYLFNIYLQLVYMVLANFKLIEQLQISENNYRILFENSPVPTYIHQDNKFVLVNPKFYEITGYSREEIENITIWDLVHPEDKPMMVARAYKRMMGEEVPSVYEFRAVKKSGEVVQCIGYFSRIIYNGKPAILGEISDITHIKSLEKQLMQAQKLETIGTLTAGIAHDFNNIIGTIAPSAQLIMMDPQHPQTARRAEIIYKMAERAGRLTSQLLAFTRNEKSEVIPFNLNKIIQDSLSLIEKSIHVKVKLKLDLEEHLHTIEGDPNQFIQIIMNLVVNANDAMPDGGELLLKTRNVRADASYKSWDASFEEGDYVMFSVKDTGIGIPAEIRDKIFDPFFTTKKRGKGTGLGLSMVYGITKSHNGIILVKSEPGQGTEFQLFFPASQKSSVSHTSAEATFPSPTGGTILAIDDERDLRVILDSILKYLGYNVILAKDGQEGIELFRKHQDKIDLVLLDYILPDSDGREIFHKLQQIKPGVNVLVCSGYSEREGIQELLREGVKGVLPKPFTIESISRKLKEVIQN